MRSRQEVHPRTAVINKSQKNQSRKARDAALVWLASKFPQIFDNSVRIQPLKSGILEDILVYAEEAAAQGISKSKLREAIVVFTRRLDYLTCLKAREMRVDLQGRGVTMVTEEEAEKAAHKIKKRIEKSLRNTRRAQAAPKSYNSRAEKISKPVADFNAHYIERQPMYNTQNLANQTAKAAAVVVKHKTARQYDPEAVARLKEKLGLSRKKEAAE